MQGRAGFAALGRPRAHGGRRVRSGPLSVVYVPHSVSATGVAPPPMVGYAVGRKVGPAVVRNGVRRRLRAMVAARASTLAAGSYLVIVAPGAPALTRTELDDHLGTALAGAMP